MSTTQPAGTTTGVLICVNCGHAASLHTARAGGRCVQSTGNRRCGCAVGRVVANTTN